MWKHDSTFVVVPDPVIFFLAYGAGVGTIPIVVDTKLPPSTSGSTSSVTKPQKPAGKRVCTSFVSKVFMLSA